MKREANECDTHSGIVQDSLRTRKHIPHGLLASPAAGEAQLARIDVGRALRAAAGMSPRCTASSRGFDTDSSKGGRGREGGWEKGWHMGELGKGKEYVGSATRRNVL